MQHFRTAILVFASVVLCAAPAQSASSSPHPNVAALKRFLRAYAHYPGEEDIKTIRFAYAPLPGTGLLLAYMQDQQYCGTGGCGILILKPQGRSFQIFDVIGGCWPPFTMLPQRHHGMPDIGIWIQGGSVLPGYQTSVSFNGKRYAYTQGFPPTHRIRRGAGRILIREEIPKLRLYP